MHEYESLGHMTRLNEFEINDNNISFYLPHHAVTKSSSETTKTRVVFNAF